MSKIESKREREKRTVTLMIHLYCRKKHGTKKIHHPIMAVRHLIESKKEKTK